MDLVDFLFPFVTIKITRTIFTEKRVFEKSVNVYTGLELTSKEMFNKYMSQGTAPKQLLCYFLQCTKKSALSFSKLDKFI